MQKQTLFVDKPITLDDIKQNMAQYINLSASDYEKSWTKLWSPDNSVSQSSRGTHIKSKSVNFK